MRHAAAAVAVLAGALALAGGALAVPATAVPSAPQGAGLGIRLVEAPVARAGDPRARVYIVDHVAPGTRLERRVEVTNGTGEPARVRLYARPARIDAGRFLVDDPADLDWISVTPSAAELADGGAITATVSIAVPADAPPGERYAAVLAEQPAEDPKPGQIAVTSRVGVRVYLSVGRGGEPASDFRIDSLQARRDAQGTPVVGARVVNTGRRALDLAGELRLSGGPGSLEAGPFPAQLGTTLAPGDTSEVVVRLHPALPAGPWLARIALRSGQLERAAQATVTFPSAAGDVAPPVAAEPVDRQILLPLAVVLLLLAVGAVVLAARRRQRERADAR